MIYVIGQAPQSALYDFGTFEDWYEWIIKLREYELDVETTYADHWKSKKLQTIQFGYNGIQWVIQPKVLTQEQAQKLIEVLQNDLQIKIIHNAYFELTIFKLYGITIRNVYCTWLAEKILFNGDSLKGYGLDDIALRRLFIVLSKDEDVRFNFGDGVLTEAKVLYAAQDVTYLTGIKRMQLLELHTEDLDWVASLEFDAVISYAWMTAEGIAMNKEKWLENVDIARPIVQAANDKLNKWLFDETFKYKAIELKYLNEQDEVRVNFNSHHDKRDLLQMLEPTLTGSSKAYLLKWLRDNPHHPNHKGVHACQVGLWEDMLQYFTKEHRDAMIRKGLLRPAWTPEINWNSPDQVLPLFKMVDPRLPGLSADALGNFPHRISEDLGEYKDKLKLIGQYGEDFFKYIEEDGKVRSSVNQIVDTGRISMRKPNMQNIPAKEEVGMIYRNCFIPPPGFKVVDSDYISQELVLIAIFSQDPVWLGALRRGEDLHSVCADLVYGNQWRAAAIEGCKYYERKEDGTFARQKCKCPGHKTMRTDIKTINFGLAYGMSKFKFARTKGCSVAEADATIKLYFVKFPNIRKTLDGFGKFAYTRGYIKTYAPFFRKRWFPEWKYHKNAVKYHPEPKYNAVLGAIQRAGMNTPIQGTAADCAKLSICMIRWYIEDNNLYDLVKLVVQVHDQNTTFAREDFADEWNPILTKLMCDAAKVFVPNGLLGAETNTTDVWSK